MNAEIGGSVTDFCDRLELVVVIVIDLNPRMFPRLSSADELGKRMGILNPQKNPSRGILPNIDFIKQIRPGTLDTPLFTN